MLVRIEYVESVNTKQFKYLWNVFITRDEEIESCTRSTFTRQRKLLQNKNMKHFLK